MKLLLDEGLPARAATLLEAAGVSATHVRDVGLAAAEDDVILERARAGGFTVVTLDADFHHLLALSGATAPSVVRIRVEGLKSGQIAEKLESLVRRHAAELESGVAVSMEERRVRIHRLPLV